MENKALDLSKRLSGTVTIILAGETGLKLMVEDEYTHKGIYTLLVVNSLDLS